MPIDPSISLQAGKGAVEPINLLQTAGQAAGLANAVAQNRAINAGADQAQQGVANDAKGWIARQVLSIMPVAEKDPQKAWPMIEDALNDGMKSGRISPQVAASTRDWLHATESHTDLMSGLHRMAMNALEIPAQAQHMFGSQDMIDFGGEKKLVGTSSPFGRPLTNAPPITGVTSAPGLGNTPSPALLMGTTTIPARNPDGTPKTDINGKPTGETELITGAELARLGGMFGGNNGRNAAFPQTLLNPNRPTPSAPSQPTGSTGSLGLVRAPADVARDQQTQVDSGKAFSSYIDAGRTARERSSVLGNLLTEAQGFSSGAGSDTIKKIGSLLISRFPDFAKVAGVDANSIGSREGFDKMVAQIQQAQGAGSDARLAVNQAGFPTSQISPAGLQLMLRQLQGNEDYTQARAKLAREEPNKGDISSFEGKASILDPRAFQYQRMTIPQRNDYMSNLKKSGDTNAMKSIMKAYDFAEKNSLFGGG